MYYHKVPGAANIKAITGLMDGVVSSRMHLAIAALGMNVPVLVSDYQGKFSGLFKHFRLPQEFVVAPTDFISENFEAIFDDFYSRTDELWAIIKKNLPEVLKLSQKNFTSVAR